MITCENLSEGLAGRGLSGPAWWPGSWGRGGRTRWGVFSGGTWCVFTGSLMSMIWYGSGRLGPSLWEKSPNQS